MKPGTMQYFKGEKNYEELGEKQDEYEYEGGDTRLFPRIWDGNDPNHAKYYQNYLGLAEGEKPSNKSLTGMDDTTTSAGKRSSTPVMVSLTPKAVTRFPSVSHPVTFL
jgi:hypothetical protein